MGLEIRSVCCEAGQNRKLTSENRITEGKRVKLFHCTYFLVSGSLSTSIFLSNMLKATWRTSQTEKGIYTRSEVSIFVANEFPKKKFLCHSGSNVYGSIKMSAFCVTHAERS